MAQITFYDHSELAEFDYAETGFVVEISGHVPQMAPPQIMRLFVYNCPYAYFIPKALPSRVPSSFLLIFDQLSH